MTAIPHNFNYNYQFKVISLLLYLQLTLSNSLRYFYDIKSMNRIVIIKS